MSYVSIATRFRIPDLYTGCSTVGYEVSVSGECGQLRVLRAGLRKVERRAEDGLKVPPKLDPTGVAIPTTYCIVREECHKYIGTFGEMEGYRARSS